MPGIDELPGSAIVLRDVTDVDAPYEGARVRSAAGQVLLRVDAASFAAEWPGWAASSDGHVLAPVDIERRVNGHWVLFPLCTETVGGWILRRAHARAPLLGGEAVTLSVSIVRAAVQLRRAGLGLSGATWWLEESGRPVVAVPSPSVSLGADDTATVLEELAKTHPTIVEICRAGLARVSAGDLNVSDIEDSLFAADEPTPLNVLISTAAAPSWNTVLAGTPLEAQRSTVPAVVGSTHTWLQRHVDERLADRVSDAGTALWRRLQRPGTPRRKAPWVLASAAAAAVLAAGLLWPTDDGGATASERPVTNAPTPQVSATATPTTDPADLVQVTIDLVAHAASCSDDVCTSETWEQPSKATQLIPLSGDPTLVENFGDVAVLRAPSTQNAPDQLILIARGDQGWLIRDVYVVEVDGT